VPPGAFEIEAVLIPAVGDKDITSLQDELLASKVDASPAFDGNTRGIQVMASTRNLGGGVKRAYSAAGNFSYGDVADCSRRDLAVERQLPTRFDTHRADVPTDEISPVFGTLPLGLEASYSVDNNSYETWYLGVSGSARW